MVSVWRHDLLLKFSDLPTWCSVLVKNADTVFRPALELILLPLK